MKKVYIAGKITGDAGYREKFAAAEQKLTREGYIVLSPAVLPEGMTNAEYMRICFAMIDVADKVAFLDDFPESQGARLEWDYCAYTKKEVVPVENFTGQMHGDPVGEPGESGCKLCRERTINELAQKINRHFKSDNPFLTNADFYVRCVVERYAEEMKGEVHKDA